MSVRIIIIGHGRVGKSRSGILSAFPLGRRKTVTSAKNLSRPSFLNPHQRPHHYSPPPKDPNKHPASSIPYFPHRPQPPQHKSFTFLRTSYSFSLFFPSPAPSIGPPTRLFASWFLLRSDTRGEGAPHHTFLQPWPPTTTLTTSMLNYSMPATRARNTPCISECEPIPPSWS